MNNYSRESRPVWESVAGWGNVVNVTIKSGVTSIGDFAFSFSRMTRISIPDTVKSIGI